LWVRKTKLALEIVFCGLFFIFASIYLARRFMLECACLFKAFYFVIVALGIYGICASSSSFPKSLVVDFSLFLFAFLASIFWAFDLLPNSTYRLPPWLWHASFAPA
jgi:hypothetical protein